jgi:hypothetical protein
MKILKQSNPPLFDQNSQGNSLLSSPFFNKTTKESDDSCHRLFHGNTSIKEDDNNCCYLLFLK